MNSQIFKISEVMEDIKETISDNKYKIIMDNLMNLHNNINIVKTERQTTGRRMTDKQIEQLKNLQVKLEERIRRDGIEIRREKYRPQSIAEKQERLKQRNL